ncbi:MAG: tripartite tricarboxylate transporter substrate-binding protein [Beijerinckiaceae bacterium]|nr:tripartite tricarboxylate transporter substrate-binding protein [Beijerinckiaceae bacterium]
MRKSRRGLLLAIALGFTALAPVSSALAQSVQAPSKITIFVGYSATSGIGYDTYGRVMSRFLGKYLPGNPTITVSNRPGAGSMTLANYIANVAPKDGSEIALIGRGVAMDRLVYGDKSAARFDATKLNWLGSMNNEVSGFYISDTAPVKNLKEVLAGKALNVGSAGAASDLTAFALVMNSILGSRLKIIDGYPGTTEILLALERGEVDGLVGYSWGAARTGSASMLKSGKLNVVLQLALKKHPELAHVPLIMDLVKAEDERQVLELIFARQTMGRPFVAPPGMPGETVNILRSAFTSAMKDAELIATADKMSLEIDYTSGEDVQELVERLHKFPLKVIQRTQEIILSK